MSQHQNKQSNQNGSVKADEADPEVMPLARRRRFSVAEKVRVLEEADGCTAPGAIGAFYGEKGSTHRIY